MNIPAHKTKIMIHCLATAPGWGQGKTAEMMVREVTRWHTDPPPHGRGWSDIAYAEIIDYDGRRAKGRDLNDDGNTFDDTGAGARGHNRDTIHIALAGGRWPDGRWGLRTDAFSDHFTPAQDRALRQAIAEINAAAGRDLRVMGHNEVDSGKGCPAFDVPTWLRSAPRPERTSIAQSTTMQAAGAQVATAAAGGVTAVAALDDTAQVVAIAVCAVVALAALWIMRERVKKWARGVR